MFIIRIRLRKTSNFFKLLSLLLPGIDRHFQNKTLLLSVLANLSDMFFPIFFINSSKPACILLKVNIFLDIFHLQS